MSKYCLRFLYRNDCFISVADRHDKIMSALIEWPHSFGLVGSLPPLNLKCFEKGDIVTAYSLRKLMRIKNSGQVIYSYRNEDSLLRFEIEDDIFWIDFNSKKISFSELKEFVRYFIQASNSSFCEVFPEEIIGMDLNRRYKRVKERFISWFYPVVFIDTQYCISALSLLPEDLKIKLSKISIFSIDLVKDGILIIIEDRYLNAKESFEWDAKIREALNLSVINDEIIEFTI